MSHLSSCTACAFLTSLVSATVLYSAREEYVWMWFFALQPLIYLFFVLATKCRQGFSPCASMCRKMGHALQHLALAYTVNADYGRSPPLLAGCLFRNDAFSHWWAVHWYLALDTWLNPPLNTAITSQLTKPWLLPKTHVTTSHVHRLEHIAISILLNSPLL